MFTITRGISSLKGAALLMQLLLLEHSARHTKIDVDNMQTSCGQYTSTDSPRLIIPHFPGKEKAFLVLYFSHLRKLLQAETTGG